MTSSGSKHGLAATTHGVHQAVHCWLGDACPSLDDGLVKVGEVSGGRLDVIDLSLQHVPEVLYRVQVRAERGPLHGGNVLLL